MSQKNRKSNRNQRLLTPDLINLATSDCGMKYDYISAAMSSLSRSSSASGSTLVSSSVYGQLAIDQLIHLLDGWRYIASASHSLLLNAELHATHFAYYAELRAVMSMLSGTGICISNSHLSYVDSAGKLSKAKECNTHPAVYSLWKSWIKHPQIQSIFSKYVFCHSKLNLETILMEMHLSSSDLVMEKWAFDLLNWGNDKNARNKASYEPIYSKNNLSFNHKENTVFLGRIWEFLASTQGNNLAFERFYCQYFLANFYKDPENEQKSSLMERLSSVSDIDDAIIEKFFSCPESAKIIFNLASAQKNNVKNIFSRALLMLLLATVLIRNALKGNTNVGNWLRDWFDHARLCSSSDEFIQDKESIYFNVLQNIQKGSSTEWFLEEPDEAQTFTKITRPDACLMWGLM